MTIILNMTEGAKRMAETDPHGFTLALIAVTTVFIALVILYFVYSLIGRLSQPSAPKAPKASRKKAKGGPDTETAAAIAVHEVGAEHGGVDAYAAVEHHVAHLRRVDEYVVEVVIHAVEGVLVGRTRLRG